MVGRGAALIVTLVLSFGVVLGLGWLVGRVPSAEPKPGQTLAAPAPPLSTPPLSTPPPEPLSMATASPVAPLDRPSPDTDSASSEQATTVAALEPDASGVVRMGRVTAASRFMSSSLNPTVTLTRDQTLQVCVHLPDNRKIIDAGDQKWEQADPPNGNRYCAYPDTGTDITFTLAVR
jgi:hypothetical protein